MNSTFEAESAYNYHTITDITWKRLNEFLQQAEASPEKAETLLDFFSATFQLWFKITRDDPTPQREKDGPRFLDLIVKFPESECPQQGGTQAAAAMTFEDARATLMANAAIPGDYADLTTWDALRAAADAELIQATYHINQLEDVVRSADVCGNQQKAH